MAGPDLTQPDTTFNDAKLLSSQGWYYFGQLLLESTYLQPFKCTSNGRLQKERVKTNTHNGHIEREIHGAMHASRVAWSTGMLHRLCQQQYPEQVQNKIQTLMEWSHLSEEELFYLIRYVGLGHDVARENDWREGQSAVCIALFLQEHDLDSQLATLFSHLASFKDRPNDLSNYLASHNLNENVIDALHYARLLVSLADYFDMIRCNASFDFALIEQKLAEVFPYSKEQDAAVFFDYAKQMLQLLKRQSDLYCPTQLIAPNKEIIRLEDGEEHYSVQEKVKLEHADYALAAMLDSFNHEPYFRQLLTTETPEYATLYDKEPAFNPYIHGTTSAALALMTQTDFQLMSAIEMLEQYGLAPLCGELTQGGFSTAMSDGKPCFARLSGEKNSDEYSLKKVMQNYAKTNQAVPKEVSRETLELYRPTLSRGLFSGISIFNICLARARQMGIYLLDLPEVQSLEKDFQHARDIFYLYLLFSTHIVSKKEVEELSYEDECALQDALEEHLSLQNIFNKLQESNISIRDIYNNPTAENCQKIITLLTLPEGCVVQQLFEYVAEQAEDKGERRRLGFEWGYMVRNVSSWNFETMLFQTYTGAYDRIAFQRVAPKLLDYLETLEKRFLVTQDLLQHPLKPLLLCPEDTDLIETPLPIILCCEQSRHMRIVSKMTQEYRAQKPLELGVDIQTVATDTEANVERLKAYSNRYHLNLNVILFADLEHAHSLLSTDYPLSRQQVLQPSNSELNTDDSLPNQPLNADIERLRNFCTQQRMRFQQSSVLKSLTDFQTKAEIIILSEILSSEEKKAQLKICAHQEFAHQDYVPRLLADALLLISSLALVGLAVGMTRVFTGHSFFFSTEKTRREKEFIVLAEAMELNCDRAKYRTVEVCNHSGRDIWNTSLITA